MTRIQVGNRYKIQPGLLNGRASIPFATKYRRSIPGMSATVTYLDSRRVTFQMQGVPGYYGTLVSMPLDRFSAWFEESKEHTNNIAAAVRGTKHSDKEFPDCF